MKRFVGTALIFALLSLTFAGIAIAQEPVKVFVNGNALVMDVQPILEKGRTLIPLRFAGQALGGQVGWNEQKKEVTLEDGYTKIVLTIGDREAIVNGSRVGLDTHAKLVKGRTMVPLRFFSESMGASVQWDGTSRSVFISTNPAGKEILGFYAFKSFEGLQKNNRFMSNIASYWYGVNGQGKIVDLSYKPADYRAAVNFAQEKRLGVEALIVQHNREELHSFFLQPKEVWQKTISDLVALAKTEGYFGINLDFELVKAEDKDLYVAFAKELGQTLHNEGLRLSICVPAVTALTVKWHPGFDYNGLGQAADRIVIMAYDEHYKGGAPGPVASYPWVEKVIQYALSQIPKEKVLLGLGIYGYDWPQGQNGTTVDLTTISNYIEQKNGTASFHSNYQVPYFTYTDEKGLKHEVWYEDASSIRAKVRLAKRYELAGVAVWRIGVVPEDIWNAIGKEIAPRR